MPEEWRVHTSRLLQEIINCSGQAILYRPLQILGHLLAEVGEEAARINDPRLNALMCRLTVYAVADPDSPDYDEARVHSILAEAHRLKEIENESADTGRENQP